MTETSVKLDSKATWVSKAEKRLGITVRKPTKYPLLVVTVRMLPSLVQNNLVILPHDLVISMRSAVTSCQSDS